MWHINIPLTLSCKLTLIRLQFNSPLATSKFPVSEAQWRAVLPDYIFFYHQQTKIIIKKPQWHPIYKGRDNWRCLMDVTHQHCTHLLILQINVNFFEVQQSINHTPIPTPQSNNQCCISILHIFFIKNLIKKHIQYTTYSKGETIGAGCDTLTLHWPYLAN